jgi:hypothetical protein
MANTLIRGNATDPRIFPWASARDPEQISRITEMSGDVTLNQEKLYELGRTLKLGVHKLTPDCPVTLTQNEYGSMAFWRSLANMADPGSGEDEDVTLEDLKNTIFDISAYMTDEAGTFKGTAYFPKQRLSGFSINIADPDAMVVRNFDLAGEQCRLIKDSYLAFKSQTASGAIETVTLSPVPIEYASGKYIYRVIRDRAGDVSELVEDSSAPYADNTWHKSGNDIIVQTCVAGDIIKIFYPAATAYTTLWTDNDVDSEALYADQCTIYLKVGAGDAEQVYKLQSVTIDAVLDRADYKQIGSKEVMQTGVNSKTVTVTIGRILDGFTLEDILADVGVYKDINVEDFPDTITLLVKIYTTNEKTVFKCGYKVSSLSPTALTPLTAAPEEMNSADNTLESDNFLVSTNEADIA